MQAERLSLRNRIEKKTAYSQELKEQVMGTTDTLHLPACSSVSSYHRRFLHGSSFFSVSEKYVGLQNLIQRNEHLYSSGNAPSGGVALPFILVQVKFTKAYLQSCSNSQAKPISLFLFHHCLMVVVFPLQTRPHATVEVEISEDMQLVHFDFNR